MDSFFKSRLRLRGVENTLRSMSTVRQLLQNRLAELTAKLPELEADRDVKKDGWVQSIKQVDTVQHEIAHIALMLKTLDEEDSKSAQPTIMRAIMEVLKEKPEGMAALEILAEINRRYFGGSIVRTSLSPQLSRLKDRDHKIILRGNRWYLAGREEPTLFTPKS
jgi:hypothetical protein